MTQNPAHPVSSTVTDSAASPSTCLVGGCGVVLGSVVPLALALAELLPIARGEVPPGDPLLHLVSSAVLGLAFVILALGLDGVGIAGRSWWGRAGLILFGVHPFAIRLAAILQVGNDSREELLAGHLSLAVGVAGLAAGGVAAVAVARSGPFRSYARWALVPVVTATACALAASVVPVQAAGLAMLPLTTAALVLTCGAGVAYATSGRSAALRRLAGRIEARW